MKTKIVLLFLFWTFIVWGQEKKALDKDKQEAEKIFRSLGETYSEYLDSYKKTNEKLQELNKNLTGKSEANYLVQIQEQYKRANAYNDTLALKHQLFLNYKGVYKDRGVDEKEIDKWYGYTNESFSKSQGPTSADDSKVFIYYGENKVVDEDFLKDKNDKNSQIVRSILNNKGKENYFGDITIPYDNQEFYFYKYYLKEEIKKIVDSVDTIEKKMDKNHVLSQSEKDFIKKNKFVLEKKNGRGDYIIDPDKKFKFKKLDVDIRDGYFYDIRVLVEDYEGNNHVFTNQIGLSILFFSQYSTLKMMYYKNSIRKNALVENQEYTDENLNNLYINLSDVMNYTYKMGNHYIPHDLILELPEKPEENNKVNATYQIKQETYLEKILELRAYTDFLTLFGGSKNGLAQVEGRAKFYLFPYPFRFFGSRRTLGQIEYFPSVSPYVNYSRFENDSKFVNTIFDTEKNQFQIENDRNLGLIEKRYLTMGLDLEVLKWQNKNAPVRISLYGLVNYNISQVNISVSEEEEKTEDVKSMGCGGGFHLSAKRFNNFGFDYKADISWYNYRNFNTVKNIDLPSVIPVFRHEAEIFYHPNGSPNQAIFARLITFNYMGGNSQAFYQFQFGYKFSIGNRAVNK
ncbi:hypothetical protein [Chryseobacterium sp. RU33C]|uniref:hypothetical protein n=1 Tax=Chryseobacterium sp. RU33C TaxID=1907398 RepID=UPI0009552681|nr:hypothetical protein [Chryseobacterium sp. RU33C]SIQ62712.1 hypothetical protein SAMN05880573_1089 [Chryseobacterium sp. RU33C]